LKLSLKYYNGKLFEIVVLIYGHPVWLFFNSICL